MTCIRMGDAVVTISDAVRGEGRWHGRVYRWDFDARFGPVFVRADSEPLKRQPAPGSHAWLAFDAWLDGRKA